MNFKPAVAALVMLSLTAANPFSFAAASATETEKLKSELIPLGTERAGNKDGAIAEGMR